MDIFAIFCYVPDLYLMYLVYLMYLNFRYMVEHISAESHFLPRFPFWKILQSVVILSFFIVPYTNLTYKTDAPKGTPIGAQVKRLLGVSLHTLCSWGFLTIFAISFILTLILPYFCKTGTFFPTGR